MQLGLRKKKQITNHPDDRGQLLCTVALDWENVRHCLNYRIHLLTSVKYLTNFCKSVASFPRVKDRTVELFF